jgi:hypothetical protein
MECIYLLSFSLERILLYKSASVVLWLFAGTVLGCAWTHACQHHTDGRVDQVENSDYTPFGIHL